MRIYLQVFTAFASCSLWIGCADHHGSETDPHSHDEDAQSFSGATHKEGSGISLLPETRERLGVQLEEVSETVLPDNVSFRVRVYEARPNETFRAAGFLSAAEGKELKPGTAVRLQFTKGVNLDGVLEEVSATANASDIELVVRFHSNDPQIRVGSFLEAQITIRSDEPVLTIPREALITGTTESFVYVENGAWYLRTPVKPGRRTADSIEIQDGLFEGDSVVTRGAMDLWLVELRAVKGGQGCCPAPPAKGKAK